MNIEKCISCKHYEPFLNGCYLYQKEVYLGEGDFDVTLVSIKSVTKEECEYEQMAMDVKNKVRRLFEDG